MTDGRWRKSGGLRRIIGLAAFIVVLASGGWAQSGPEAKIMAVIDAQQAAWNRGDLEGYMAGYWKSPELSFYSGGTVTTGWQPTLERYKTRYQGEGREMGHLDFSAVKVHLVGADGAWVEGHWRLTMKSGQNPGGLFTVIFRKFPEGWRIVHDHSSAE